MNRNFIRRVISPERVKEMEKKERNKKLRFWLLFIPVWITTMVAYTGFFFGFDLKKILIGISGSILGTVLLLVFIAISME